jgi:hypothetical protein
MLHFSLLANWMMGSRQVDAEVDDDCASIPRRRAPNCNAVKYGGADFDEKGIVDDVDGPDMIGCFLETIEGITRELCSLLLRACSKETEVDRTGRTNCGAEAGEPIPADPRQNMVERIRDEYFQRIRNGCNTGSVRQIKLSYWKYPWNCRGAS